METLLCNRSRFLPPGLSYLSTLLAEANGGGDHWDAAGLEVHAGAQAAGSSFREQTGRRGASFSPL